MIFPGRSTVILMLFVFLFFVSCNPQKNSSHSRSVEELLPSQMSDEEIAQMQLSRMEKSDYSFLGYGNQFEISFQERFVPSRLYPEALRLDKGHAPRLIYQDGSSEELPFAFEAPARVEIPVKRAFHFDAPRYKDWAQIQLGFKGPGSWYAVLPGLFMPLGVNAPPDSQNFSYAEDLVEDRPEPTLDGLMHWRILATSGGAGGLVHIAPSVLPLEGLLAMSSDGKGLLALGADHSILYYSLEPGRTRSTSLDYPSSPSPVTFAQEGEGRALWALSVQEDALSAMLKVVNDFLRLDESRDFADVSIATKWTRVPRSGAVLVRLRFEQIMNARISLDSKEDYLMVIFNDRGERLADNMGYGAAKTLSRSFQPGPSYWLALSFLQEASSSARLLILDADAHKGEAGAAAP